jgi:hypothetical protein
MKNRKLKQFLSGSWYQWDGEGGKERVKETECSGNIIYSCMELEK